MSCSPTPTPSKAERGDRATGLARGAADWMAARVLVGSAARSPDVSLYHGTTGIVLALHEAAHDLDESRWDEALTVGVDALVRSVDRLEDCSLYFGLTGVAFALATLGRPDDARRALVRVRAAYDGVRWGPMTELLAGNAGIGLGALAAGDVDLAVDAVTPYLDSADPTAHGVNWAVRPTPARSHHVAHGTLGIVLALAAVGQAAGREDLLELAVAGAADVVGRNEAGPDGFLVPHSDPPHRPDLIERYSYGWCNGPAGDAQVFRLLRHVTGEDAWVALQDRCWRTVTTSGLPERVRPGFWDNHGRCCGTAGVLALALDRMVERDDDPAFADLLVDDLAAHAVTDEAGVRWSNHEHRVDPPELPPEPGWAMGNAGILRELVRYARLCRGGSGQYVMAWPDHPPSP